MPSQSAVADEVELDFLGMYLNTYLQYLTAGPGISLNTVMHQGSWVLSHVSKESYASLS